jgi:hypothetical protein
VQFDERAVFTEALAEVGAHIQREMRQERDLAVAELERKLADLRAENAELKGVPPKQERKRMSRTKQILMNLLLMIVFCVGIFLFWAIRPASAAVNVELPNEMLGAWCGSWSYQFPESNAGHLWRADHVEDCANRGGIHVRKDGWDHFRFQLRGVCKFVSVQLLEGELSNVDRDGPIYRVHADCKGVKGSMWEGEEWHEAYDMQTFEAQPRGSDGQLEKSQPWLVRWELPEEG